VADRSPEPVLRPAPDPTPVDGPPHLSDPRAMTILSTEHWSLLSARSLTYNEFFSRGSMFLTLLSASLVALGFVYQGGGGGPDFPLIVVAVLALDLFVGLATLGRLVDASYEEMKALQAMSRIRHAYLEMVPALRPYFSTSSNDDLDAVLEVYGVAQEVPSLPSNILHGLTTMPGMLAVINAAITGALGAAVVVMLGGDARLALVVGLVAGLLTMAVLTATFVRIFSNQAGHFETRFPSAR
jgi:hypothetical protein